MGNWNPVMNHLKAPTNPELIRKRALLAHVELAVTEIQEAIALVLNEEEGYAGTLDVAWKNLHHMANMILSTMPVSPEIHTPRQRKSLWHG